MRRAKTLSTALFVVVFAGRSLCGTSEAQTPSEQPHNANVPFAVINESLHRAADSTLSVSIEGDSARLVTSVDEDPTKLSERAVGGDTSTPSTPIESILAREGVPAELSAVVKVESSGNRFALSSKGARGLWQLMPETARRYGLQVDSRVDERIDVERSTEAAARYLRDLYSQFGSWPLALAAYNTGESNLQRAINRAGSDQFAVLSFLRVIPAETRNYVPAVLANMRSPSASTQSLQKESIPSNMVYAGSASSQQPHREEKQ